MTKYGTIVALKNGKATLQVPRSTACGDKCGSCSSHCNQGMIEIDVRNDLHAHVGDRVEVESTTQLILGAAFLVYVVPLIMMFLGIILTNVVASRIGISPNELVAVIVGLFFLALTFVGIKICDRKRNEDRKQIFTMTKIM
ncbi:positive regulator of sigma(E), RseC/MucC [Acetoanaerobium noterae]|jgi:Positive regulator of sigma E activity|uniref:Positive regulator of sigma(E), RseC/MucC n=2 Tax=root TaxID=1 RepID=A0A1T5DFY6_9FIRM|nr:SoxR reducing system RseC family protein [Acetoanaerobium noterae]SKB70614.1 positive regulator of sigma(E), RseC/MucC [Acetoanaerobium noterae]